MRSTNDTSFALLSISRDDIYDYLVDRFSDDQELIDKIMDKFFNTNSDMHDFVDDMGRDIFENIEWNEIMDNQMSYYIKKAKDE